MPSASQAASRAPLTFGETFHAPELLRWPGAHAEPIHGAIVPADVRAGDPVTALVRAPGRSGGATPTQVWRISPLGVELVRPPELDGIGAGAKLELLLRVGRSTTAFPSLIVMSTRAELGRPLLGLKWTGPSPGRPHRGASRSGAPGV